MGKRENNSENRIQWSFEKLTLTKFYFDRSMEQKELNYSHEA